MVRPTSVKIGPFDYTICYREDLDPYRHLVGVSHHEDLQIWIKEFCESKMKEILTHEIMHGIIHIYGGAPQEGEELSQERTVTALGFGWLQTLRDNPQVMEWLGEE